MMSGIGVPGETGYMAPVDQGCFKQLFELLPDPAWIIDGNQFVECNEAAIKTLGYSGRDELLNVHPSKLSPARQPDGEDSFAKAERMMAIAKDSGLHQFDWLHTRADGSDFLAEVTLSRVQLSDRQLIYCVWRDITERKKVEQTLKQSLKLLAETERIGNVGGWEFNIDTGKQNWTEEVYRIHEVDFEMGPTVEKGINFYSPESRPMVEEAVRRAIEHGEPFAFDAVIITAKGNRRNVHATGIPDLEDRRIYGFFQDITKRKQAEAALGEANRRWQTTFDSTLDAICLLNVDQTILQANASMAALTGISVENMIGKHCWKIVHGTNEPIAQCPLKRARSSLAREQMELQIGNRWLNVTVDPVLNAAQEFQGAVHIIRDITEHKQMEDQVRQLAYHDTLTQLPNRRLLVDRLSQAIATSKRTDKYGALMMLDLDNFKPLNDAHGHLAGDLLLTEVARRLMECVRETDTVARLGGDEFVILLGVLDADQVESTKQAAEVAEKIRLSLNAIYQLTLSENGQAGIEIQYHCSASIGVALFINHSASEADILKRADSAMYLAKEDGRNAVRFYGLTHSTQP